MGKKKKKKVDYTLVSDYTKLHSLRSNVSAGWEVEPEEPLVECSLTKATYLMLSPEVISKCHVMMTLAGTDEWLGYLAVSKEETNEVLIYTAHDVIIPWQSVSGISVDVCAFPAQDNENIKQATGGKVSLNGVVHSHHHMDIRFSGTDHEYINQNSEISLLLAHQFGFHAEAITTTLCGKKTKQEIQVIPFTKDRIIVFNNIEHAFRNRIRSTTKQTGYTNEWEYSYPTKRQSGEPIVDAISVMNANGQIETVLLGGEEDDNGNSTEPVAENSNREHQAT
jgi:hypothetical protein